MSASVALKAKNTPSPGTVGRIIFDKQPNIDPIKVITLIQKRPWMFKLDGQDKLRFEVELPTVDEREERVVKLMGEIGG